MATAAVANGTDAPKRGRAKKGEGPYTVSFIDNEDKEHNRVPAGVKAVKITQKDGKASSFTMTALDVKVIQQLAADGLKRAVDTFVRNGIGGDKSAIVLASEKFEQIKSGKIYARKEGASKPGRSFDFDLYIAVAERTAKLLNEKNKKFPLPTKKQLEAVGTQLRSLSAQERNEKIKKHKQNPMYALAYKQVVAERATSSAASEASVDGLEGLF